MIIGTPLWDDFVENLREVKLTVEGMKAQLGAKWVQL